MTMRKGEPIRGVNVGGGIYDAVAVSCQKGKTVKIEMTVNVKSLPREYSGLGATIADGQPIKNVSVGRGVCNAVAVSRQEGETVRIQLTANVKDLPPQYCDVEVEDAGDDLKKGENGKRQDGGAWHG